MMNIQKTEEFKKTHEERRQKIEERKRRYQSEKVRKSVLNLTEQDFCGAMKL